MPDARATALDPGWAAPLSPDQRIQIIDAIRGFALFGVLAANMPGFVLPAAVYMAPEKFFPGSLDVAVITVVHALIQGKFMTLFSVLFGVGFAVQMDRAAATGRPTTIYKRRLTVLALIGLAHGLSIWWGDILLAYALTGFLLLLFRNRSQRTIGIWALALGALPILMFFGAAVAVFFGVRIPPGSLDFLMDADAARPAIDQYRGAIVGRLMQNVRDWAMINGPTPMVALMFVLPRFLAGLWIWRTGVLRDPAAHLGVLRRVLMWSGTVVIVAMAAMLLLQAALPADRAVTPVLVAHSISREILTVALATLYGVTLLLLGAHPRWQRGLKQLAAVGRMALTNYLLQSIFMTWFFFLTGLYARVGPALLLPIACLFYAAQLWFSRWWLERYRYGPAEWLWRSLTYGRMQPMV